MECSLSYCHNKIDKNMSIIYCPDHNNPESTCIAPNCTQESPVGRYVCYMHQKKKCYVPYCYNKTIKIDKDSYRIYCPDHDNSGSTCINHKCKIDVPVGHYVCFMHQKYPERFWPILDGDISLYTQTSSVYNEYMNIHNSPYP